MIVQSQQSDYHSRVRLIRFWQRFDRIQLCFDLVDIVIHYSADFNLKCSYDYPNNCCPARLLVFPHRARGDAALTEKEEEALIDSAADSHGWVQLHTHGCPPTFTYCPDHVPVDVDYE